MTQALITPSSRCVIVTGGARGLGWEMADALVQAGHRVLITGARERSELDEAAERLQATAARSGEAKAPAALALQADVSNWDDCQAVARLAMQTWGRIDALVNNAGRGMAEVSGDFNRKPALFWESDPQAVTRIIDTNVSGAFLMARACVPTMVAQGFGRVLNISTSLQTMVRTGYCPYGPSKAALEAMSVVWARDLAGTGVTVNVLLPGGASDTRLIPGHGPGRTGADGLLLPPALMRAPALWLLTEAGPEVNGRRFVARRWPTEMPAGMTAEQAAQQACEPVNAMPSIM